MIAGTGQVYACSSKVYPDLFSSVLGGLGQTAVIFSAKVPLEVDTSTCSMFTVVFDTYDLFIAEVNSMGLHAAFEGMSAYILSNTDESLSFLGSVCEWEELE